MNAFVQMFIIALCAIAGFLLVAGIAEIIRRHKR